MCQGCLTGESGRAYSSHMPPADHSSRGYDDTSISYERSSGQADYN